MMRALLQPTLFAVCAAVAAGQAAPAKIDAGHSYATIWMGLNTEVTVAVNTGVAQVGGSAQLVPAGSTSPRLTLAIVPGGPGTELLTPKGTIRAGQIAAIASYTAMAFQSTSAEVRRDGYLEFTGTLTVTHVTRHKIMPDYNLGYSGSTTYTDPISKTLTRPVKFAVQTPRAEFLPAFLKEGKEVIVSATIDAHEFPELPDMLLDSDWPIVAQDRKCATGPVDDGIRRDYGGTLCTGKAIAIYNPATGPPPSTGRDYSGMPRPPVPKDGPVTIVLHVKLAAE